MTRLALLALLCSCSSFIDDKAASSTLRILDKSMQAASRQGDLQLAREALPGGIVQLEAFALAYPKHPKFRVMHADALCQYAVAFVFDDWEDASLLGNRAASERIATRLSGLLRACVAANEPLPASTRKDLWLATAGAVEIALAPFANVTKLPSVKKQLAAIATKAPGFRNADAEILLGTLEAATAGVFGGPDGTARFDAARKLTQGRVLNVDVMFARAVAVARKDRKLFSSTLEGVLAANVEQWPEQRLANELARTKAQRYLTAIDVLIPPR